MDEQNQMNGEKGGSGLKIAAVVILIVVVLAGLYFWSQRGPSDSSTTNKVLESINQQSSSDDPASIQSDLESTDIDNLDAEFNAS